MPCALRLRVRPVPLELSRLGFYFREASLLPRSINRSRIVQPLARHPPFQYGEPPLSNSSYNSILGTEPNLAHARKAATQAPTVGVIFQ